MSDTLKDRFGRRTADGLLQCLMCPQVAKHRIAKPEHTADQEQMDPPWIDVCDEDFVVMAMKMHIKLRTDDMIFMEQHESLVTLLEEKAKATAQAYFKPEA